MLRDRRKRDRAVEPGHRNDQVIVDRQCTEALIDGSCREGDQMIEGVRMTPKVHEWKMDPELHSVPPRFTMSAPIGPTGDGRRD